MGIRGKTTCPIKAERDRLIRRRVLMYRVMGHHIKEAIYRQVAEEFHVTVCVVQNAVSNYRS